MTARSDLFTSLAASVGVDPAATDHVALAAYFDEIAGAARQLGDDLPDAADAGGDFDPGWPVRSAGEEAGGA